MGEGSIPPPWFFKIANFSSWASDLIYFPPFSWFLYLVKFPVAFAHNEGCWRFGQGKALRVT